MTLSKNAEHVFYKEPKYCLQNETIEDCFRRVANEFSSDEEEKEIAFHLLNENIWRPNTPVFLNAGSDHKIFSACYVVGLEDSMKSIYDIVNTSRRIFQFGAGVGIPVGNLREQDAYIYEGKSDDKPPEGKSSGPIIFMKLFDAVGETTKSGGRVRRAAILCSMPVWHPDITKFIQCKEKDGRLANMNISILITDKFMQALEDNTPFELYTPYNGTKRGEINPYEVWTKLAHMAHKSADPGVIFIDQVNRYNPLIKDVMINATNPCVIGDTKIIIRNENKKLKEIKIIDFIDKLKNNSIENYEILSYNIEKKKIQWDYILNVFPTQKNTEIIEIELETGEILQLTPDHKIYTENRGYVQAKKLNSNDIIITTKI